VDGVVLVRADHVVFDISLAFVLVYPETHLRRWNAGQWDWREHFKRTVGRCAGGKLGARLCKTTMGRPKIHDKEARSRMLPNVGHPIIDSSVVPRDFGKDVVVIQLPSLQIIRNVKRKPVRVVPARRDALGVVLVTVFINSAIQEELVGKSLPLINSTIVGINDVVFGIYTRYIVMNGYTKYEWPQSG
jgi:hypothetical protein